MDVSDVVECFTTSLALVLKMLRVGTQLIEIHLNLEAKEWILTAPGEKKFL